MERIRQNPNDEQFLEQVREEIQVLVVAGNHYRFRIEPRCHICQDDAIRKLVNTLLAKGMSVRSIQDALQAVNNALEPDQRISRDSIYNHRKEHFDLDVPAAAVYRRMVEQE